MLRRHLHVTPEFLMHLDEQGVVRPQAAALFANSILEAACRKICLAHRQRKIHDLVWHNVAKRWGETVARLERRRGGISKCGFVRKVPRAGLEACYCSLNPTTINASMVKDKSGLRS